jgi:hypothetical protein
MDRSQRQHNLRLSLHHIRRRKTPRRKAKKDASSWFDEQVAKQPCSTGLS